jgi:hypothetical protein
MVNLVACNDPSLIGRSLPGYVLCTFLCSFLDRPLEYLFIFKILVSITDLCNYEKINNFNIAICCGVTGNGVVERGPGDGSWVCESDLLL